MCFSFWFRSHQSVSTFITAKIPVAVYLANHVADFFAGKGTEGYQYTDAVANNISHIKSRTRLVQERILEVSIRCAQFEIPDLKRAPKQFSAPVTISAIRESQHALFTKYIGGNKR